MATATLFPGSVVTQSGIYVISHSTKHRPDSETVLYKGLILPDCPECRVSYSLLRLTALPEERLPNQQQRGPAV